MSSLSSTAKTKFRSCTNDPIFTSNTDLWDVYTSLIYPIFLLKFLDCKCVIRNWYQILITKITLKLVLPFFRGHTKGYTPQNTTTFC